MRLLRMALVLGLVVAASACGDDDSTTTTVEPTVATTAPATAPDVDGHDANDRGDGTPDDAAPDLGDDDRDHRADHRADDDHRRVAGGHDDRTTDAGREGLLRAR